MRKNMETFRKLNYIFNRKQKIKILLLLCIIVIGAFLELMGITAVLPFIEIAVSPNAVFKNEYLNYFYDLLEMESPSIFLAVIAMGLAFIYVFKNIYLSVMNYLIFRFTYNNQRQLAYRLLKTYLKQPYTFFVNFKSSDLIRNVSEDTSMLFDTVLSIMQLMVECIICLLLVVYLLIMDKSITFAVGFIMVGFLLFFMKFLKKNIQLRGVTVRKKKSEMSKWLLQALGGIKETKILGKESFFLNSYDREYYEFAQSHCIYQTLSYLPKPAMETVCIAGVLGVVALKLVRGVESEYFVSTMAVFAVAAFRLLPAFNRITGYISRIMFNKSGVSSVYDDLKQVEELDRKMEEEQDENLELNFQKEIEIRNLKFRYPGTEKYVLKDISLSIPKNKSIAFIGPSGAGKTTLADIILGILTPEKGSVFADNTDIFKAIKNWQKRVGYIPQSIYLLDDTIRHNVAYGVTDKDIDEERLYNAIEEAQLKEFVEGLEEGVDMMIGERGIRLSGGQRQRIGIARALYTNPEILVLDEATSALDTETETAVMEAIDKLAGKKTLIIIAHRLSTIEHCDYIYEIKDSKVELQSRK